jgi:hypothetical protein
VQDFIFSAVSPGPQRPGSFSGRFANGHCGILSALDLREDFSASSRHKAGTNSPGKHQLLAAIEANDQRIEGIARCVAADDEFLAEIDPILASNATIVAGGVATLLLSIGAIIGILQGIWR